MTNVLLPLSLFLVNSVSGGCAGYLAHAFLRCLPRRNVLTVTLAIFNAQLLGLCVRGLFQDALLQFVFGVSKKSPEVASLVGTYDNAYTVAFLIVYFYLLMTGGGGGKRLKKWLSDAIKKLAARVREAVPPLPVPQPAPQPIG